ncbi:hypothetical protein ACFVHS_37890 [Streptomyces sp. NPDC057746]|uniref:hypothetical protein n=1 Tax=Streptomyces sp. NPDC057746 TaxID=3346237 RepID=UPI00368483BC
MGTSTTGSSYAHEAQEEQPPQSPRGDNVTTPWTAFVRIRKQAAALILVCNLASLAGCSESHSGTKPSHPSATSTSRLPATSTDPTEVAKKEAVAAYAAYWGAMERLYADPTDKSAHLDQYAASAALKNAEADAKRAHGGGLIYIGSVALTDQTVGKVDTSGTIPNATVSSCLDISKWLTVDAKTKKPVSLPENRLTKYVILSTLEKYPEGWRVIRDEPQGKPC